MIIMGFRGAKVQRYRGTKVQRFKGTKTQRCKGRGIEVQRVPTSDF